MTTLDSVEARVQRELQQSARPEPPRGIYLQLYRGAIHGTGGLSPREVLAGYVDRIAALQLPGVVFHGFPEELRANWDGLAKLAADRGVLALASWGLDGRKANDGSTLTAAEKGALCGDVLARASCSGGLLDAEGQWDADAGPADDMDEAGARALASALQAKAPGAWVGDQPWYAIEAHGDLRRTAKPADQGGIFAGFPVDEFAPVCRWGRYRQAYIYRSKGAGYASTFARMDREWGHITPALQLAGLERPLRVTLQGYGWLLHEQVHALIDRGVRQLASVIVWCDPWPDPVALQAIRAAMWLERQGYAKPGVDARAAVLAAQAEFRRTGARIDADGAWGPATHAAAGLA